MPGHYIANGVYFSEDQQAISPENRSYRYGDGLFETIRMGDGRIPLWELHCKRLFSGLQALRISIPDWFNAPYLLNQVLDLCRHNDLKYARIRIVVSRSDNGTPQYSIQTWPLDETVPRFNIEGLRLGVFRGGRKSMDMLSNLKSNNYLIYALAALYAKDEKVNDALVLNTEQRIADASIANIYWVKGSVIFTPPLSEGPVDGVMKSYLCQQVPIQETPLDLETLRSAEEVFVTNAVRGIQWVKSVEEMEFHSFQIASKLHNQFILPVFS
jgi:branched-chain amino acid aminotransferase